MTPGVFLSFLGLGFQLVAVVCWVLVLAHAFQRSLGTGVMVLLIPFYNVVYSFTQFEHRRKGLVLAGAIGGLVLAIVLRVVGTGLMPPR
jgi:translocator protein